MSQLRSMEQLVVGETQLKGPHIKTPYTVSGKNEDYVWLTHPTHHAGIIRSFDDLVCGGWEIYTPYVDVYKLKAGEVIYSPSNIMYIVICVHGGEVWVQECVNAFEIVKTHICQLVDLKEWTYTR